MRVFFGVLGGLAALVLYFIAWFRSVTRGLPKGVQIGISPHILFRPTDLVSEVLVFSVGFIVVYMLARPRA